MTFNQLPYDAKKMALACLEHTIKTNLIGTYDEARLEHQRKLFRSQADNILAAVTRLVDKKNHSPYNRFTVPSVQQLREQGLDRVKGYHPNQRDTVEAGVADVADIADASEIVDTPKVD